MSNLSSKLIALKKPAYPSSLTNWFQALDIEDKGVAWAALTDPGFKNYTLYGIFREEGLRMSKDKFVEFRNDVLAGKVGESDLT